MQFNSCTGRDWKFADAYLEKGIALFEQGRYQQAMQWFPMTVKVQETYADGYFWIGRCYEATGNKDQAIAYYHEALAFDKDFAKRQNASNVYSNYTYIYILIFFTTMALLAPSLLASNFLRLEEENLQDA